ncbi:MAG: hypothetical protein M1431_05875 [Candidatus Thermoplasmatota archaeon]|nr:hypothetical protein [Candidatus Thermoplasmatota archaeon]
MDHSPARDRLLQIISENPGIHFREIQRLSGMAVGQTEYHLYQLERSEKVMIREDGKNRRYFIPDQGSLLERKVIFYLRGNYSSFIIQNLIRKKDMETHEIIKGRRSKQEKLREALGNMEKDGIILKKAVDGLETITLANRDHVIQILKKYRKGFIGMLEENLYSLLDES